MKIPIQLKIAELESMLRELMALQDRVKILEKKTAYNDERIIALEKRITTIEQSHIHRATSSFSYFSSKARKIRFDSEEFESHWSKMWKEFDLAIESLFGGHSATSNR